MITFPDACDCHMHWPHPNIKPGPSNASLLDWALGCFGSQAAARGLLVDNPARLYGF